MSVLFNNPAGAWALLAIPAIVTIHFLRPAARHVRVSTLFLLDPLDPGRAPARRLRRLRATLAFWLQILAALLVAWLLAEPRWRRDGSRQTVAVILDSSASMEAFRDDVSAALEREMSRWEPVADRTTWWIRESDSRRVPLYRGDSSAAARAALGRWHPNLGAHALAPVVSETQLAAPAGSPVILITDHRVDVSAGTTVVGVGRAVPGLGFVGASVEADAEGVRWRALVLSRLGQASNVSLSILDRTGRPAGPARELSLEPGKVLTVEGRFPQGVDALQLTLPESGLRIDDRLCLVRPRERELRWAAGAELPELFSRFTRSLEDATPDATSPDLRIFVATASGLPALSPGAAIVAAPRVSEASGRVATAPVVAERHPLVDGLVWDGLIAGGPATFVPPAGATVLLWQGARELVWLENAAGASRLVLNFEVGRSNAARLPAFVVLLDRYLQRVRGDLRRSSAANVETHQRLALGEGWRREPGLQADAGATLLDGAVVAPGEPGFFSVLANGEVALLAASRFGDARESDFSGAATFWVEGRSVVDAVRALTLPDPWRPLWLLAAGACFVGAWWSGRGAGERRGEHPPSNNEHPTLKPGRVGNP